jgi:hypothetical protein
VPEMIEQAAAWGPWAVAFAMLLWTVKDVLLKVLGAPKQGQQNYAQGTEATLELARALDKLTAVLTRMERSQEKALDEVLALQREGNKTLQEIDLRTKVIERKVVFKNGE